MGSCRRDLLDHIIALNERHLKPLLSEYVRYHHEDRTHLGLAKQTPAARTRCTPSGRIVSHPRLGGLHPATIGLLELTERPAKVRLDQGIFIHIRGVIE